MPAIIAAMWWSRYPPMVGIERICSAPRIGRAYRRCACWVSASSTWARNSGVFGRLLLLLVVLDEVLQHFRGREADVVASEDDHPLAVPPPASRGRSSRRRQRGRQHGPTGSVVGHKPVGRRDRVFRPWEQVVRFAAPVSGQRSAPWSARRGDLAALDRFHFQRRVLKILIQRDVPQYETKTATAPFLTAGTRCFCQ